MENCIRIAVCDDLQTDREKIISLLSSYLDQNELYVKIDEFASGEAFLDSDIQCYSLDSDESQDTDRFCKYQY